MKRTRVVRERAAKQFLKGLFVVVIIKKRIGERERRESGKP